MKEQFAKTLLSVCVAAPTLVFGAALVPSVSDVTMSQAQDRTVTITYKLANAPAVVTLDVQTNTTDGAWVSIGGENISGVLSGVPTGDVWKVVEGEADTVHTITWRPDRSAWVDSRVPANGARAVVTAWATNAAPDYMVFDLAKTSSQRVSYYPAEEFLPGGLLKNPDYRTTRLVMRKIPANGAVFTMGSVAEASRNAANEMIHSATLNSDYYMGVFEVTQTQWTQVMDSNPLSNPSAFKVEGAMRPVDSVTFVQIRENNSDTDAYDYQFLETPYSGSFLGKLRLLSGGEIDFDLPSEAQWEYACRAGHGEGYWGNGEAIVVDKNVPGRFMLNQEVEQLAAVNVESLPDDLKLLSPASATAIVGSYEKNDFGLYDMHGNVYEWCLDFYANNITGLNGALNVTPAAQATDTNKNDGRRHVARGGSWNDKSGGTRSAWRVNAIKVKPYATYGFRVKCTTGAK